MLPPGICYVHGEGGSGGPPGGTPDQCLSSLP